MHAEIQRLLTEIEHHTRDLLEPNRDRLDRLAGALQEHKSLEADAVRAILDAPPGTPRDRRNRQPRFGGAGDSAILPRVAPVAQPDRATAS